MNDEKLCFIRGEDPSLVITIGDVSRRTGLALDTVKHWVYRYKEAPRPVGKSAAGALYWWPDWLEWLEARRPAVYAAMGNPATLDSEQ